MTRAATPPAETRPGSVGVTIAYDGHGRMTSYARTGEADLTHAYNGLDDRISTTSVYRRRQLRPAGSSTPPTVV